MPSPEEIAYCMTAVRDIGGFDRCEFVSADRDRFEFRAWPQEDSSNFIGTAHGGYLLALADMSGGATASLTGRANVTMALSANFLRPGVIDGTSLSVVGTLVHAGRTTAVSEVVISRADGTEVLRATVTSALFGPADLDSARDEVARHVRP